MGPGASHAAEATTERWWLLGRVLVSSLHVWVLLWLLLAVVVPAVLFGWRPVVISSGSMEPLIRPGDVVLVEPAPSVDPGDVITFEDPARGGALVSHRVLSIEREGWFRTQGDANRVRDSIPVAPGNVLGRGRLLVPFIGLPVLWLTERPLLLAAWTIATMAAGRVLLGPRSPWTTVRPVVVGRRRTRLTRTAVASSLLLVALVVVASTVEHSGAGFTGTTATAENAFAAGAFCPGPGSQTVGASGATTVLENQSTANTSGADELVVRSAVHSNARALLQFPLPPVPPGCSITGSALTLTAVVEDAGRTYEVVAADAPFDIDLVTWDSQPSATGPVASTVTDGVPGATEFDATRAVIELYTSGDHGLVLRDHDERHNSTVPAGGRADPGRAQGRYDSGQAPTGQPRLTVHWGP